MANNKQFVEIFVETDRVKTWIVLDGIRIGTVLSTRNKIIEKYSLKQVSDDGKRKVYK